MSHALTVLKGAILAGFLSAFMVLSAPAALAACEQAPVPSDPNAGVAGRLDPAPLPAVDVDGASVDDLRGPDPFAAGSSATIYSEYGWGAYRMHSFDPPDFGVPGCLDNRAGPAWDDKQATAVASGTATMGAWTVAATRLLFDPASLTILNPVMEVLNEATANRLFMTLFPVAVVIAALVMAARSSAGKVSSTASAGGWIVMIGMAAVVTAMWSTSLAPKVDAAVVGTIAYAGDAVASPYEPGGGTSPGGASDTDDVNLPDVIGANLAQHLLYETWCSSHFGRNAAAAEAYCGDLFKAANYSVTEVAAIDADPSLAEDFRDAHEEEYKEVANSIKDEYPEAYTYLTGERSDARLMVWFVAMAGMGIATVILSFGLLSALLALLLTRIFLGIFPALALIGVIPGREAVVVSSFDYVVTKLVSAVAFCAVTLVWVAGGLGTLNSPSAPATIVSMVLMLLGTFALWKLIKRFHLTPTLRKMGWKKKVADYGRTWDTSGFPIGSRRGNRRGPIPPGPTGTDAPPAPESTTAPVTNPIPVPTPTPPPPPKKGYAVPVVVGAAKGAAVSMLTGGTTALPAAALGAARGVASVHSTNSKAKAEHKAQVKASELPYYPVDNTRQARPVRPAADLPAPVAVPAIGPAPAAPQAAGQKPQVAVASTPSAQNLPAAREAATPGTRRVIEGKVYTPQEAPQPVPEAPVAPRPSTPNPQYATASPIPVPPVVNNKGAKK